MTHPPPSSPMTVEEYFDFEDRSPTRHEYVDGELFAMRGVTRRHDDIVGNVYMRSADERLEVAPSLIRVALARG